VLLIGNPNTGKTTLFNRLTGQNARIGNYPGITVERRSGDLTLRADGPPRVVEVVDVPGAYSLSARSAEEQIALSAVLGWAENPRPDLCVVVVDAGQLARNLYLVTQLLELDVQVVVALNMIDEVRDNPPNAGELSRFLGVPCVATDARHGTGLAELERAIGAALVLPPRSALRIDYPKPLERDLERVSAALPNEWRESAPRARALALWALTSIESDDELHGVAPALRTLCLEVRAQAGTRDIDHELIATRYALIDAELPKLYPRLETHPKKRKTSERVDRVLLHPVFGFAIFIGLMLLMFQSLFSWSDPAIRLIEACTSQGADFVETHVPQSILRDLVTRGVIGGVGNVVVFLPQILLLFFCIGILEDSGYMARVAFLMDRIMKALGLHGRAFVPMLSGFACAVPAILATRTMERVHADHRRVVSALARLRLATRAGSVDDRDVLVLDPHYIDLRIRAGAHGSQGSTHPADLGAASVSDAELHRHLVDDVATSGDVLEGSRLGNSDLYDLALGPALLPAPRARRSLAPDRGRHSSARQPRAQAADPSQLRPRGHFCTRSVGDRTKLWRAAGQGD